MTTAESAEFNKSLVSVAQVLSVNNCYLLTIANNNHVKKYSVFAHLLRYLAIAIVPKDCWVVKYDNVYNI